MYSFLLYNTGPNGTAITVSGSGFGSVAGLVSVLVDGVACNILSIMDTMIECTVGEHAGGTFPVTLYHQVKGYALTQANFSYALQLTQVLPNEGNLGLQISLHLFLTRLIQSFGKNKLSTK